MRVRINGKDQELDGGATIASVVSDLELRSDQVAVECNGILVRRREHASTELRAGDVIEVVTLVGGG